MLAIVGCGDHVQRNILPVLERINDVIIKYIVVRNIEKYSGNHSSLCTSDFTKVLNDDEITAVYVATPIQSHYTFVKQAILAGKNVLCEKSLTTNLNDSKILVELAQLNSVKLQEVVMYEFHEQFQWIKNYLRRQNSTRLIKIHSTFQIPHLASDNIRYTKEMGGALLDVGFYPLSMLISLLGATKNVSSSLFTQKNCSVDLFGLAVLTYDEVYGVAEWGIGRLYKNEITLEFEDHEVIVQRAFSKPSSFETKVVITQNDIEIESVTINSDDHFYNLLTDFFSNNKNNVEHLDSIIERAKLFDIIRTKCL
jgi:NDP-hexose-3-ketoreductase